MLPFKLIYSDAYDLNLGAHVFPSIKYRLIHVNLLREKCAAEGDFLEPQPAADADVLRVHSQEYVRKLKLGKLSYVEMLRLEVPYSPELVKACWLSTGGTILAGQRALADGFGINIGGGFHHAFPDHGEGFCVLNDVAIAIRRLQADQAVERVMVVDTDVHQGNGTAAIFGGDGTVFTLSIHQENNYPQPKPPSSVDINLPDGIGDEEYLALLDQHLGRALAEFPPEILFYVGGADPYREDQLGGLALTMEGLRRRDVLVYEKARRRKIPVAVTLGGGYARQVEDTVQIHINTILAARDLATSDPSASLRTGQRPATLR